MFRVGDIGRRNPPVRQAVQVEQAELPVPAEEKPLVIAAQLRRVAGLARGSAQVLDAPVESCREIEDEDHSLWILKVGVGAMVRVVKVRVHVEEWDGPERVTFSFRLEGDPVVGSGSYVASALSEKQTEVTLHVRVEGSGPMAPMWEAMGAPVLNKFAKSFALDLKARIEEHAGSPGIADQVSTSRTTDSASSRFWRWLRAIFTGRKAC